MYADNYENEGYGSFYLYTAAAAYESVSNFEKALKLYSKLEEPYKEIKKEDFVIYHKARINYLMNKDKEAQKLFNELLNKHKSSSYLNSGQKYLTLIEARKNVKK